MESHKILEIFIFLIISQDLHDPSQVIHRDAMILRENQASALTSCALSHHCPLPPVMTLTLTYLPRGSPGLGTGGTSNPLPPLQTLASDNCWKPVAVWKEQKIIKTAGIVTQTPAEEAQLHLGWSFHATWRMSPAQWQQLSTLLPPFTSEMLLLSQECLPNCWHLWDSSLSSFLSPSLHSPLLATLTAPVKKLLILCTHRGSKLIFFSFYTHISI